MKTPFTLYLNQANIPLQRIDSRSFVPTYPLPFVAGDTTTHHVGERCCVNYRWHDAFDVFVAVLEARLAVGISIPVGSHLPDLYLVYQLHGESRFVPDAAQYPKAPAVALAEGQRMEVYTPPARAVMEILPSAAGRYAMAAIVPKSGWVTRHPLQSESPMEGLIQHLKLQYNAHHYLHPAPISPAMLAWLHVLLTTPRYADMRLDDALNGPMVRLLEEHRAEHRLREEKNKLQQLADAARLLVRELLARADSGQLLTPSEVAHAFNVSPALLTRAHTVFYQHSFAAYIHDERMALARELLASGKSVKEVGLALGYTSPNNFSRSFRNKYGTSPAAYRKKGGSC